MTRADHVRPRLNPAIFVAAIIWLMLVVAWVVLFGERYIGPAGGLNRVPIVQGGAGDA